MSYAPLRRGTPKTALTAAPTKVGRKSEARSASHPTREEGSVLFLKKRTKKLLLSCSRAS